MMWSCGDHDMPRGLAIQAGHDAPALLWNTAVRAAVKGGANPDVVDDIVEDMLLAGRPICTKRPGACNKKDPGAHWHMK